jgi:hypothetical protein
MSLKDIIEFFEKHSVKIEMDLRFIAKSIWTRLATLIIFYFTIFFSVSFYYENLLSENISDKHKHSRELTNDSDEGQFIIVKDFVALCIKSRKEGESHAQFYCDHAKNLYSNLVTKEPIPFYAELLKQEAFDAMIIDIDHRIRALKYKNLVNEDPKEAEILLKKYLSSTSLITFCFALVLSLVLFIVIFNHYGKDRQ